MYNKELFAKKGLTMPAEPTWDEIYELAKKFMIRTTASSA
jgi:sorbitol/mannitol transport system substrate-binding protein